MTPAFVVTLLALGLLGAFVAGLLGVGGAIVMAIIGALRNAMMKR